MDEKGRLDERDGDRDRVADGVRGRGARRGGSGHDAGFDRGGGPAGRERCRSLGQRVVSGEDATQTR